MTIPTKLMAGLLGLAVAACRPAAPDGDGPPPAALASTSVRLVVDDRPAAEVVASLRSLSGLPIVLVEEAGGEPVGRRRVTIAGAGEVPFWEAVARIEREGGLLGISNRGSSEPPGIGLGPLRGTRPPIFIAGAFRCDLLGLEHARTLALGESVAPNVPGRPVPTRRGDDGPGVGPAVESVEVRVLIRAEPRPGLTLLPDGRPRVVEAVDEKGRSLVVDPQTLRAVGPILVSRGVGGLVAEIQLGLPDPGSASIARLRAVAPILVEGGRADLIEFPLAGSSGRTFRGAGARIEVVRAGVAEGTGLEILLRPGTAAGTGSSSWDLALLDDDGRRVPASTAMAGDAPAGATRLRLRAIGGKAATRLRYFGSFRGRVDVEFRFYNVPLP